MAMGAVRAMVVGLLTFALGAVQVVAGVVALLSRPALLPELSVAVGELGFGLLLFLAARYVSQLRKRGLILAVVGFAGVVVVHFGPLLSGQRTPLRLGSVLFALVLMVYLFLHDDAFGEKQERELTEDTNTHEFIR